MTGAMGVPGAKTVWLVFGTRPEAVKLAPVWLALQGRADLRPVVCVTAQHREMLDDVLSVFGVTADHDLDLMKPGQALYDLGGRALSRLGALFQRKQPDFVLVQGDTTTTLMGALAAFYNGIPVGHVEAGLRSYRMDAPFPEEGNRVLTSRLAALHFPPTQRAADALIAEGEDPSRILVTGNTVIDALFLALDRPLSGPLPWREPAEGKKLVLVTTHRRESFGVPLRGIFRALKRLSERPDTEIVIPLHPNPQVGEAAREVFGGIPWAGRGKAKGKGRPGTESIQFLDPLPYHAFVHLLRRARLILTDSGGIQEEAPSLGIPVLVLREVTERPEAVDAGVAKLVGPDEERIVLEAEALLDDPGAWKAMARRENPFGDGQASRRIVKAVESFLREEGA